LVIIGLFILLITTIGVPTEVVEPKSFGEEAIYNTFASESYRFRTHSTLFVDNEERVFSVLNGEVSGDNRHAEGSILGTQVNIYNIAQKIYQQDPVDNSWHIIENTEQRSVAMLLAEIDPATDFAYKEILEAEHLGEIEVDGETVEYIRFKVHLEDQWVERYFEDITYEMGITRSKEPHLVWAKISAVSKENSTAKLVIENHFYDFGEDIQLQAPIQ